jgi:hypothetical protein
MARRRYEAAVDYSQYALCAAGAGLLTSVVTGSIFPLVVIGIGLYLVFGFFNGIMSGGRKPRRRMA